SEIAGGFFWLCHPLPVCFHTIAVFLFALLAVGSVAWTGRSWYLLVLIVAAHTSMQLSIAVLNDYCDRRLDAASKPEKPIPRGLVRPREALILGILLIAIMVLLLLPLQPLALLISLLYLACGLSYNLGLKSTPFSGIVFALAIPLIPLYAFAAVGHIIPLVFWMIPVAALLGAALNLANSLPDLEKDAANHARTLAVVLGEKQSLIVCSLLVLLSAVLVGVFTLTRLVPALLVVVIPTLVVTSLAIGAMFLFFAPTRPAQVRKIYFYLMVLVCFVLAGGWLIGALF